MRINSKRYKYKPTLHSYFMFRTQLPHSIGLYTQP